MKRDRSIWTNIGVCVSMMALLSCGDTPVDVPVDAMFQVEANIEGTSIVAVVVSVAAPDIPTPLAFTLTVENGVASGTVTVPAGSDRTVTIRGFDAAGVETHRGAKVLAIREGANPVVTVVLEPLTGEQPVVVEIGSITITVTPVSETIAVGDTLRLSATVRNANGQVVQHTVAWATLHPGRAGVDNAGLVTARDTGMVQIVATFGGVAAAASIHVVASGYALRFGGDDIVVIENADQLNPATAMTLEFWIRFDERAIGQWGVLKDDGADRQYALGLNGTTSPGPARRMRAHLHTPGGYFTVDGATQIPFDTWVHVAQTYDGSTLRLYVNGVLDGSRVINEAMVPHTLALTFGNNPEGFGLHGSLDEVRLWSVARSAAELEGARRTKLTGSEAGLTGYWPLDEGTGDVAEDRTAGTSNGRLGFGVGGDSADPRWIVQVAPVR